jgi:tRNA(Met) C34 N-acetyltransferase TmcA
MLSNCDDLLYSTTRANRAMPSGTGADNSVAMAETDGPSKKKRKLHGSYKKRKDNKSSPNYDAMLKELHQGVLTEAQMSVLHLILEYGSSAQKKRAMKEISSVACGKKGDTH